MLLGYTLILLFLREIRAPDPVVELDTGFITGRVVDYKGNVVMPLKQRKFYGFLFGCLGVICRAECIVSLLILMCFIVISDT